MPVYAPEPAFLGGLDSGVPRKIGNNQPIAVRNERLDDAVVQCWDECDHLGRLCGAYFGDVVHAIRTKVIVYSGTNRREIPLHVDHSFRSEAIIL